MGSGVIVGWEEVAGDGLAGSGGWCWLGCWRLPWDEPGQVGDGSLAVAAGIELVHRQDAGVASGHGGLLGLNAKGRKRRLPAAALRMCLGFPLLLNCRRSEGMNVLFVWSGYQSYFVGVISVQKTQRLDSN